MSEVRPNVEGNRRADEMLAEDQVVCRRVRLTARLGATSEARKECIESVAKVCKGQSRVSWILYEVELSIST